MAIQCSPLTFDGALAVPPLSVYGSYPFTYTAWVYLNNYVAGYGSDAFIGMVGSTTVSPYWSWFVSVAGADATHNLLQLLVVDNTGTYWWDGYWAGLTYFPIQQWVFVAGCVGPTGFLRIYQNAVPGDTAEGSQSQTPSMFYSGVNNNLMIGTNLKDSPSLGFNGMFDDVRFYNRRLSEAEIQTMYALRGNDGITYGLQGRWTMGPGPAGAIVTPKVIDMSANRNDANVLGKITKYGVGVAFSTTSNGFTSAAFDTTGADFIVIALAQASGTFDATISDSKLNTWHKLTIRGRTDNQRQVRLYYAYAATTGTAHTFTVDGTSNFPSMSIAWYHGVLSTSDPFTSENGSTVLFTTSLSTGSVTPTEEDCLVIVGTEFEGAGAGGSYDSGFVADAIDTNTAFGHQQSAIGHLTQTTPAASASSTWTQAGSSTICVAIASFKSGKAVVYAGSALNTKRIYNFQ